MAKLIQSRMAPRNRRPPDGSALEPTPALLPDVVRPPALAPGSVVRIISPASPADPLALSRGVAELERLGYHVHPASPPRASENYFAAPLDARLSQFTAALQEPAARALIAARGGYGSAALLDGLQSAPPPPKPSKPLKSLSPHLPQPLANLVPKLLIGYSDITALQIYFWQRWRWTTIYGPMVAAGFDAGADQPGGYDLSSFLCAVGAAAPGFGATAATGVPPSRQNSTGQNWTIPLGGETLVPGAAAGVLLGGCLTLLQTTLGTPWELETRGAILLLEDRGVKPYQLDRMLVHLSQAGKFRGVRGLVLGEFPDCDAPPGSPVTTRDVCRRLLSGLGIPITFAAAVGHTSRPMRSVPLGVRARLVAVGEGQLEILEPAVSFAK